MLRKFTLSKLYDYGIYRFEKALEIIENITSRFLRWLFLDIALIILSLYSKVHDKGAEGKTKLPTILVLRKKYYSKTSSEKSTELFHLDNTITDSGLAQCRCVCYEDLGISFISDIKFYLSCLRIRPEVVVLSSWGSGINHPDPKTICLIRKILGIKFVSIWWDTCFKEFESLSRKNIDSVDLNLILDNPMLMHIQRPNDFKVMWVPQDDNLYRPAKTKDIPVSFMGQAGDYRSYRAKTINYIIRSGVAGVFSTQNREKQVSHSEYAKIMGKSKIVINFSQSVDGHQCKGRVMEVIRSGALLLESKNDQISKLFVPMEHYVPFVDERDLLLKIEYYLKNDLERNRIAESARAHLLKRFSNYGFWEEVLNSVKVRSQ